MASGNINQPIYPKIDEASAPPAYETQSKPYPTQPMSYPTQPQPYPNQQHPGYYPTDPHGKPADPAVGYWHPQQPGYTGVPQSDPGYAGPPGQPGVVFIQQKGPQVIMRERESFVKQIVLSCVVTWCCCWPMGLIAFILAMIANSKANATDEASAKRAHCLGVHSFRLSIAGLVLGVILIVTYIILQFAPVSRYYEDYVRHAPTGPTSSSNMTYVYP